MTGVVFSQGTLSPEPARDLCHRHLRQLLRLPTLPTLTVDYDGTEVGYDFTELDELLPAYAISVHRSQGSEYPAVVVPVMTQHYPLLQRNLLYTAVTRARRLAVLVGSPKAMGIAVRNGRVGHRHTGLAGRLAALSGQTASE